MGHDLFIDVDESEVAPFKGRALGLSDYDGSGPVGRSKDWYDRPRIVNQCAGRQCYKIEAERPGEEDHENRMKAIERAEGDPGADSKCECRSMR